MSINKNEIQVIQRPSGLMHIVVNRPRKGNALTSQMLEHLLSIATTIDKLASELQPRGILLMGSGSGFIAGADIGEQSTMTQAQGQAFGQLGQSVANALENLPCPVVACVDGYALGGGLEMAMACDFIFATENSVLGLPEVSLGLIPGFGGMARLPRYVGIAKARELIFSAAKIAAQEAHRLGLVHRVFDNRENMIGATEDWLLSIIASRSQTISQCKKVLTGAIQSQESKALNLEYQAFSRVFGSSEMQEGVGNFLARKTREKK